MSKNLKLKKVNKSFVPEPISSVFGFLYAYEHSIISWSYFGPICYIRLFGAGGQGMPFMAWFRIWVHEIRETAKKHRNQCRLICYKYHHHNQVPWHSFWLSITIVHWRCPLCNGYRRRKWTRQHEFKSWTTLITFHKALIPLGKEWIQLFSLQLWVNSRAE